MDEKCPGPAGGSEGAQQLDGRQARAGQVVGVDAPDRGDVLSGGRIGDHPVAGQLVRLLPVLAPTLAVALTREGAIAAPFASDEAEREGEVDRGGDRRGALAGLLDAAAGEDVDARASP